MLLMSDELAWIVGANPPKVVKSEQVVPFSVPAKLEPGTQCVWVDEEVIEILLDSEDEIITVITCAVKKELAESATRLIKEPTRRKGPAKECKKFSGSNLEPFDPSNFTQKSDTIWTDSDITSYRIDEALQVTLGLQVDRAEYLSEIPNVWPVPQVSTAFIVDLQDSKFFQVWKSSTDSALGPLRPDSLIKSKV